MSQRNPGSWRPSPGSSCPPTLLDQFANKYRWSKGATRGTEAAREVYQKDLDRAFAEIDGLMAGFTILDETCDGQASPGSSSSSSPMSLAETHMPEASSSVCTYQYAAELSDDDIEGRHSSGVPSAGHPDSNPELGPKSLSTQWTAIRSLGGEMEQHHQKFLSEPCFTRDPILGQLRDVYQDSKGIRKTGILLFRDILDGYCPTKLNEIFAFATLAYSVSTLLHREGRIDKSQILGGLRSWMDAISDPGEREAFIKLALHLWPEAKEQLQAIPMQQKTCEGEPVVPTQPFDQTMPSGALDNFGGVPSNTDPGDVCNALLPGSWSTYASNINSSQAQSDIFGHLMDLTGYTKDTWDFSNLQSSSDSSFTHFNHAADPSHTDMLWSGQSSQPSFSSQMSITEHAPVPAKHGNSAASQTAEQNEPHMDLRDTYVFTAVIAYLTEINELLDRLSGWGLFSKPEKRYKAAEEEHKRFYKSVKEEFFEPRSCGWVPHPNYNALLSIAKNFAREACLRTAQDVQHYLISVAVVSKHHRPQCLASSPNNARIQGCFPPRQGVSGLHFVGYASRPRRTSKTGASARDCQEVRQERPPEFFGLALKPCQKTILVQHFWLQQSLRHIQWSEQA